MASGLCHRSEIRLTCVHECASSRANVVLDFHDEVARTAAEGGREGEGKEEKGAVVVERAMAEQRNEPG